eukprot:1324116-Pleurochrysis_carterae.AAC.2
MRPRVKNRSTESYQRPVVEGISRLPAAKSAVRLPRERRDTKRKRRSTTAPAVRAREVLWRRRMSVGLADF